MTLGWQLLSSKTGCPSGVERKEELLIHKILRLTPKIENWIYLLVFTVNQQKKSRGIGIYFCIKTVSYSWLALCTGPHIIDPRCSRGADILTIFAAEAQSTHKLITLIDPPLHFLGQSIEYLRQVPFLWWMPNWMFLLRIKTVSKRILQGTSHSWLFLI